MLPLVRELALPGTLIDGFGSMDRAQGGEAGTALKCPSSTAALDDSRARVSEDGRQDHGTSSKVTLGQ